MSDLAGYWIIALGLLFLGLCIESGLAKIGRSIERAIPRMVDVNHRREVKP